MPRLKPPPAKAAPETPEIEEYTPPVGAIEIDLPDQLPIQVGVMSHRQRLQHVLALLQEDVHVHDLAKDVKSLLGDGPPLR